MDRREARGGGEARDGGRGKGVVIFITSSGRWPPKRIYCRPELKGRQSLTKRATPSAPSTPSPFH